MGGDGPNRGASAVKRHCGGYANLVREVQKVTAASTDLLNNRSATAASKNVAIFSHYPDWFQQGINLREKFLDGLPEDKRDDAKVFNFYGHTHAQHCDKRDPVSGECTDFLTGAAGGCCGWRALPAGFTAITWNEEKTQVVDFFEGPECRMGRYSDLPKGASGDNTEEICEHTEDDSRCAHQSEQDN